MVAEASNIPAEHLSQSDWQSLAALEQRLRRSVAGQDAAVGAVVGAVRLGRLGLTRGARPLASLLLTGPAGVGKSTLCAALAEALFGSSRHLLRLNLAGAMRGPAVRAVCVENDPAGASPRLPNSHQDSHASAPLPPTPCRVCR